jgi:hypothetical protein
MRTQITTATKKAMNIRASLFAGVAALCLAGASSAQELCTHVKIQISQELTLTKSIFVATLDMTNDTSSLLENVEIDFTFEALDGTPATYDFTVYQPTTSVGFTGPVLPDFVLPNAYDLGNVLPASTATVQWPLEALESAAWDGLEHTYKVSGVLRYTKNGTVIGTPLFPVEIQVLPAPKLVLDYYLQDTVWSDDPLTPGVVEPTEPFILGLRIQNLGFGVAKDVKIKTEQPKIIDNVSGLIIAFKILAASLGCDPATPILDLDMGDIQPGETQVIRWVLASTLKGNFSNLTASFTHKGIGESLIDIDSSGTHFGIHNVKLGSMNGEPVVDDLLPDFLVDEGGGDVLLDPFTGYKVEDLPTRVDSSDGTSEVVHTILNVPMDAAPTAMDLVTSAQVTVAQTGWTYLRLPDLGPGEFRLSQVSRNGPDLNRVSFSVGTTDVVSSAWTTRRNVDVFGSVDLKPDAVQYLVHLFNHFSVPGTYTYDFVYTEVPTEAFSSDIDLISTTIGGAQHLTLNAGPSKAGQFFFIVGTASGTSPGTPLGSVIVPINLDSYTLALLGSPGLSQLLNFAGNLDANGQATAQVLVPPGTDPALAGLTFHHAYVLVNGIVDFASNAVPITLSL